MIDGYNIIRNDRNRHGGGVCMYIRSDLAFNIRIDLQTNIQDLEAVWCDILLPRTKPILLGTIYRPQTHTRFVENFDDVLSKCDLSQETYIFGDFNICLLNSSPNYAMTKDYLGCLTGAGLQNLIKEPTRVTEDTESLLDHVLCNNTSIVSQSGVIPVGLSDHFVTYCTRRASKISYNAHNTIHLRSLKNYSIDTFNSLLAKCDWSPVLSSQTVDAAWGNFKPIFAGIVDQVAPKRVVRIKQGTEPWITPTILDMIKRRDKIRAQLKKNYPGVSYLDYSVLRNQVQREIKKAKASFFKSKLDESMGDSKKLWNNLKTLGYSQKPSGKSKIVLDIDGELCYDTKSVCSYINTFFINIASELVAKLPPALKKYSTDSDLFTSFYKNKGISPGNFKLQPIEDEFILNELKNLNITKGAGLDDLAPRFLRDGAAEIAGVITYIVNLSITTESVPDDFKASRVTPIYKKKSKLDVSNYRPVSVLSCVSKILEKSVYVQVESYLSSNDLIFRFQSGFRPGYSTETCLIYLTDFMKQKISQGNYVGMLLLDVQKAFDSVDHSILVKKLEAMGISPGWFVSYLTNRRQLVSIDGISSSFQSVTCGVPQGSLLGPLLYLCYSNDMELAVHNKLMLYADDSVIIAFDKDPNIVSNKLSMDLQSCNQWLIDNKLSLHLGKTECILFGTRPKLSKATDFSVCYNTQELKPQDSITYLGVLIDNMLSGDAMVSLVIKKVTGRLKFLYRHSQFFNRTLRKTLCAALLQSHIDYCCTSWFNGISQKSKRKLQVAQNRIVRFILNLQPREHVGQSELNLLNLLNIKDRTRQLRLSHAFKIFNSSGPSYLNHNFTKIADVHTHNTRSSQFNFLVPSVKGCASNTFYYNTILDWNALPPTIKSIPNFLTFKQRVKKHLADKTLKQEMADFTV